VDCKAYFNFLFDVGSGDGNQLDMDGGPPVDGVRRRNNVWRWPVAYDEATVVAGERTKD
jgi:hypothetical protein